MGSETLLDKFDEGVPFELPITTAEEHLAWLEDLAPIRALADEDRGEFLSFGTWPEARSYLRACCECCQVELRRYEHLSRLMELGISFDVLGGAVFVSVDCRLRSTERSPINSLLTSTVIGTGSTVQVHANSVSSVAEVVSFLAEKYLGVDPDDLVSVRTDEMSALETFLAHHSAEPILLCWVGPGESLSEILERALPLDLAASSCESVEAWRRDNEAYETKANWSEVREAIRRGFAYGDASYLRHSQVPHLMMIGLLAHHDERGAVFALELGHRPAHFDRVLPYHLWTVYAINTGEEYLVSWEELVNIDRALSSFASKYGDWKGSQ